MEAWVATCACGQGFFGWLIEHLKLVGWLVDLAFGWLIGWLIDKALVNPSISCLGFGTWLVLRTGLPAMLGGGADRHLPPREQLVKRGPSSD